MFCGKCGGKCDDQEVFCASCGAPLNDDAPQSPPQQTPVYQPAPESAPVATAEAPRSTPKLPLNPRMVGMVAVGVVAVIVIALLVSLLGKGGGKSVYLAADKNAITTFYSQKEEANLFFANGKQLSGSVENVATYNCAYSLDMTTAVILDNDSTLYIVTSKGVSKVADDVDNYALSTSGGGVAYISDGDLYLYPVSGADKTKIASDVDPYNALVLSPDGKSVAFVGDDDGDSVLYLSKSGKKPVEVRKNGYPVGLADNGTLYFSREGDLYTYNGKEDSKLASGVGEVIFNADISEAFYQKDDKFYVSIGGKEPVKVTGNSLYGFVSPASGMLYTSNVAGLKSFKGFCFQSDNGAYRVTNKLETVKFAGSGSNYVLSQDGGKCLYLKGYDLYLVSNTTKDGEAKQLTDDAEIVEFFPNTDCSAVYFRDSDNTLMYQKGTGKAVKVADDVESIVSSFDGTSVYFTVDDALFTSTKGGKKTPVKGADDVEGLYRDGTGVRYVMENDDDAYDYYYAASGTNFTLMYADAA